MAFAPLIGSQVYVSDPNGTVTIQGPQVCGVKHPASGFGFFKEPHPCSPPDGIGGAVASDTLAPTATTDAKITNLATVKVQTEGKFERYIGTPLRDGS
jgi:hypothetical protein